MANNNLRSFVSRLLSLFFFLFGCFSCIPKHNQVTKKRKHSSNLQNHPPPSPLRRKLSSSISHLKSIFSFCSNKISGSVTTPPTPRHLNHSIPSPSSSTRSLHNPLITPLSPQIIPKSGQLTKQHGSGLTKPDSNDPIFFPLRNDIYPCTLCGEIFQKTSLLEQHQAVKHAVSELFDIDSGKNIVQIIFKTGWPEKARDPIIHRILKIHNSPKILSKFEEYRESIMAKAEKYGIINKKNSRCLADGNELLRFHCTTFLCEMGKNDNSSICSNQYCSACGVIRCGFSTKMDGISTLSTSWRAHVAIPEEMEEDFKFMHVKRAMLICRVIAGRVGLEPGFGDKGDPGYDSLVGRGTGLSCRLDEEDELLVFNPRAVLPCFVIVYTV
ncbi:hypothetical protein Leryth_009364 [Lithospermum erythrorhizon]|nr:hypothetical protein Leryth_009364 [Lithospermum erythrorhizon]